MTSIVVCGGGVIGLATAMMLARDGHRVTVLEANPEPPPVPPEAAWERWTRNGVAQFRQPHTMFPAFREVLRQELPDLLERLTQAGCSSRSLLETMPPGITDRSPRPGDDRLHSIAGRRPVVEAVFGTAAAVELGVKVRRGVRAVGLLDREPLLPGVPHVVGVRTDDGDEIQADLVIDAMGRRTPSAVWLAALGARGERGPQIESEDLGFAYYSRFYTGPESPRPRAGPLTPIGSFSLLTLPGDNNTWSVTVYTAGHDPAFKALRDPARFDRLLAACPAHAHWAGTPITDVLPMAGIQDRHRRFLRDGRPVVTGYAAVGDAWACTNPSGGRGLSIGLIQAQTLRRVIQDGPGDPVLFQLAWDTAVQQQVTPFYQGQAVADRARIAEMTALRDGREPPPPDPLNRRLQLTAQHDAGAFRTVLELMGCLELPEHVFGRPGFSESLDQLADPGEPLPVLGPDRETVLDLLTG